MKKISKYILDQVASNQLSIDDAKNMLLEIQSQEASQAASEDAMADSQELAQASSEDAMANSQKLARATSSEVAIIGMAGKFPKAANLEEFWENLRNGSNCIGHYPENRKREYWDQCSQSAYVRLLTNYLPEDSNLEADDPYVKGGFLSEIDKFDAAFFRIPPKEALYMDPVQRVFLETVYEAIEDAGYGGKKIQDAKVGVFAGKDHTNGTMYRFVIEPDPMSLTGSWTGILASRISYIFNLRGPSMVIDTACSSGLVALHEACRAFRNNECELAIVGGIHLQLFPTKKGSAQVMEMVESAEEQVKTFDKTASGTVWGEGAGAVLLKPLAKAIADRDHIYAVIKGSAINNDGASSGITAPNAEAQKEVILRAWKEAQIDPETISYIEAHGTGTNLGDPIEIKGITAAFSEHTGKKQFCGIGSAKTNVGHLVAASGLASVMKVVLALKNNLIPPSINFQTPNPFINFCDSPVYVNDQPQPWDPESNSPRRAGISSFGFSGTNCHIVLEEAPAVAKESRAPEAGPGILTLSARGENVLKELVQRYQGFLEKTVEAGLADICYTANTGRGHYQFRIAIMAANLEDLKGKIARLNSNDWSKIEASGIYYGVHKIVADRKSGPAENHITESERRKLTHEAAQKLQELVEAADGTPQSSELAAALCQMYVKGADILWDKLYQDRNVHRVSLPTYPLERIKCWAGPNNTFNTLIDGINSNQKPLHPLIHRLLAETFEENVYLTAFNVNTHWVLNEHQVLNFHVVPGTTYLEMARAVSGAYFENGPVELRDFLFMTPLVVNPGEVQEVQTIIKRQSEYLDFVVTSKTAAGFEDSSWVIHAQGKIYQVKPEETRLYNLMELRQKLDADHNQREINPSDEPDTKEFTLGPRWRNVVRTIVSGDEALLQIKLPQEFEADLQDYFLHPALMDQAVNAFSQEMGTGMYLPFMYKKLTVYGPMPASFYSYLRRKGETGANMETITMDISLVDESGRVFAEVFDYSIKKARDMEYHFKKLAGAENTYYGFQWIPVEPGGSHPGPETGSILVFKDQAGIAAPIIRKLQESGRSLIEVEVGPEFQQVNQNKFSIHGDETDYHQLLKMVSGQKISQILHFMAILDPQATLQTPAELETRLLWGLDSLFYLARALAEHHYPETIELVLLADHVQEVSRVEEQLNPHHAAFFGLGKVISLENEQIKLRVIDLDHETTPDRIVAEIQTQKFPYQVAYRRNQRFVEEFRRIKPELKPGQVITENGVYLITGGTGGIGLEIGKYLAGKARVKLALINRSAFPGREDWDEMLRRNEDPKLCAKITAIREMERAGSEVILYSADVANEAALKQALEEVRQKFGKINGVIHAAGVAGAGFMIKKDIDAFKKAIAPKVQGTWLLDQLTGQDNLDFFSLFSSITTITGGPGQSDYTAANAYLDAFAASRNRKGKRTISINWPLWNGIGMAADYQVTDENLIFKALTHRKALEMFEEILNSEFISPGSPDANAPTHTYVGVIPGELNYQVINTAQEDLPFQLSSQITAALKKQRERIQVEAVSLKGKADHKAAVLGLTGDNEDSTTYLLAQIWARVLGLNEIEVDQNFYDMGGDSILASQLLNEINREYPEVVSISDIFTYSSVAKLAEYIDQKGGLQPAGASGSITAADWPIKPIAFQENYPPGYYPVSSAQRRMFIINQIEGANLAYNLPIVLEVEGNIDRERLEEAIRKLIKRHESLRTSFEMVAGEPVQRIHPPVDSRISGFQIEYWDLTGDQDANLRAQSIIHDFIRPFDISRAPLLRVGLVKLADAKSLMMFDMHHIISDGTSLEIFFREFLNLYEGRDLPEPRIHYKDFAVWQNEYLQSEKVRKQEEYWLSIFGPTGGGELPLLNLPLDHPRAGKQGFEGDQVEFEIEPELTARLNELAVENGATLFMVLLAAFNILLFKCTGQEDIIIGAPVAGRSRAEVEPIIGIFINTLALRNYPAGDRPFKEFLAEVKDRSLQAFDNQDYQFEALLEKLDVPRDLSRTPLFDIMFNLLNMEGIDTAVVSLELDTDKLQFRPYRAKTQTTIFDLNIFIREVDDLIQISTHFRTSLFKKSTVEYLMNQWGRLFAEIVKEPARKLGEYPIFLRKDLIYQAPSIIPKAPEPQFERGAIQQSLVQCFESKAEKFAQQTAVKTGTQCLTYAQLNAQANQAAWEISKLKTGPITALLFGHDAEMIVGTLSVLKAGKIYVPLDPAYPEERLVYMLKDSGADLIVTNDLNLEFAKELALKAAQPIALVNISALKGDAPSGNLNLKIPPEQIAYILYTSGSTGNPKGVIQNHRNVLHFIQVYTHNLRLNPGDRLTLFSSYSFDAAVMDIYGALLNGAALHPYYLKGEKGIAGLAEWLQKEQITVFHSIPTVYRYFIDSLRGTEKFPSIRLIVMGGEAVIKSDFESYHQYFGDDCLFVNGLGPTESTVTLQYFMDKNTEAAFAAVPVGYPAPETEVYLLTERLEEAPVFQAGEIVYRSEYLALGYLNLPETTSRVFRTDPITGHGRVYHSGDLGKVLANGAIQFMGRNDSQVKIRGYRIELGEIETLLLKHPQIKEAVVMVKEDQNGPIGAIGGGAKYICAYYISQEELTVPELRQYIAKDLPDYMIPAYFIRLEKMPLTPNGKINRRALPEPSRIIDSGVTYSAPQNETETKLVQIWQEVLQVEQVGVNDEFFNLGGDSMKALLVVTESAKKNIEISVPSIFKYKTIAQIIANQDSSSALQEAAASNEASSSLEDASSLKEASSSKEAGEEKRAEPIPMAMETKSVPVNEPAEFPKTKELPIVMQQEITIYAHRSSHLCIILAYPHLLPWFYQHYVNVFTRVENGIFKLDYLEPFSVHRDMLIEFRLSPEQIAQEPDLFSFIMEKIHQGLYVFIQLDDYYLPAKRWYQRRHLIMPNLIYGYDQNKKTVKGMVYDMEAGGIFYGKDIDYRDLVEAYEQGRLRYAELAPSCLKTSVTLYEVGNVKGVCPFSLRRFLFELYQYLFSLGNEEIPYLWGLKESPKFGVKVYEDLIRNLAMINEENFTIHYNNIHLVYEHKKQLARRFAFIIDQYQITGAFVDLYQEFLKLVEQYNKLRLQILETQFSLTEEFLMDQEKTQRLLQEFIAGLVRAIETEKPLLLKMYQVLKTYEPTFPREV